MIASNLNHTNRFVCSLAALLLCSCAHRPNPNPNPPDTSDLEKLVTPSDRIACHQLVADMYPAVPAEMLGMGVVSEKKRRKEREAVYHDCLQEKFEHPEARK